MTHSEKRIIFDLARQDKGYLGVAASGVSVLTNGPGNRGYDFNNDSDFINAGMGITHGDNFGDMGIGYFTAQEAGDHTFGYTGVDDRALFCLDLDQDGQFEWNGDKGQEILCTRNWSAWAVLKFPTDYHFTPNQRTVNLTPGEYKFVVMHLEYGGGSDLSSVSVPQASGFSNCNQAHGFSTGWHVVDPKTV